METAVDKLEAFVRKAESDLDLMACKLETEMSNRVLKEAGFQLNPYELIQNIEDVKREYAKLTKQYEELQAAQKEAYDCLQEEMQAVCKRLQELEERSGVPSNFDPAFTPMPKK